MGCASCGGGKGMVRCCLCSLFCSKGFPWGAHRKICLKCKQKQERLIAERVKATERVERLLKGIGE